MSNEQQSPPPPPPRVKATVEQVEQLHPRLTHDLSSPWPVPHDAMPDHKPTPREIIAMLNAVTAENDAHLVLPDPWFEKVMPHYAKLRAAAHRDRTARRLAFRTWQRAIAPVLSSLARVALAS